MTTRRALASALRAQRAQAARSAVLTNASVRDAKGAVAVVAQEAAALAINIGTVDAKIPAGLNATLADLETRLSAEEQGGGGGGEYAALAMAAVRAI